MVREDRASPNHLARRQRKPYAVGNKAPIGAVNSGDGCITFDECRMFVEEVDDAQAVGVGEV